ncbi:MAG: hypothetical protein KDD94_10285, partial [Calditrichaeota bacterium]|nr:hypothetical protein [Calditrichota bacterium]
DLLISTAADQIPITTGYVVKQWQENNRAYFHYKMDKEVMNWYAISSARYAVKQTTHRGIGIRFYYHPRHETNVSTMIESAKASLDYYIDNFGPYRYSQLKYAELPNFSYSFGATSYPNTIYSVEFRGFHMDQTNPENLNVAYLQVSHEIAHQWWADQLEPAIMAGYRFLTETLAEYSETSVYRQKYGMNGLKQYLSEMTNLYLRQRGFSSADEKPLYLAQDQSFVNYQKGVLAMHALRGLIGEEKINLALSRFINDNSYPKNPTSTELLDYFYQVADSADYQQIDDLFKRVVIYDIGIDSVETTRRGREQELNIKLSAEKIINTDNGQAIEALNEVIEIAIYSGDPRLESSQLLYLQKHRVSSKTSWIKLIVDQSASHVVIDPNYYKIERDRFNNVYKLN